MASQSKDYGCSHCDFESNSFSKAKHHVRHSNKSGGRYICSCGEFTACFFDQLAGDDGHFHDCEAFNWESQTLGLSKQDVEQFRETCNFTRKRPLEGAIVLALFDKDDEAEGGLSGEEADDEFSASSEGETEREEEDEPNADDGMSVDSDEENEDTSDASDEDVECEGG